MKNNITGWESVSKFVNDSVGSKFQLRFNGDKRVVAFAGEPLVHGNNILLNVVRLDTFEANYLICDTLLFKEILNLKNRFGVSDWSYVLTMRDEKYEVTINSTDKALSADVLRRLENVKLVDLTSVT